MGEVPVGKRRFHAFISHAHVDKAIADDLVEWLREVAGVPTWYDASNLPPGATIAEALPAAIENSRSMILLLSKESVSRGWVQHEFNSAINHQTRHRRFRILPVCLDDVNPPGFIENYSNIRVAGSPDLDAATGILKGLYQSDTAFDPLGGRHTYVSRGWHVEDDILAGPTCTALRDAGLQLIGDAEDQPSWVENRVAGIIAACGGYAGILPYRPDGPHATSKYVLREWEIATSLDLPCVIVADPRVDLPTNPPTQARILKLVDPDTDRRKLTEVAETLAEDWREPPRAPYIFFATNFDGESRPLRRQVKDVVEAITALPCRLGEYFAGALVQRGILDAVCGASAVLADISDDSPNVYIEIGAARAAKVPLSTLRRGPPGRPAFMLRDQQVWDYATDADLIGRVARVIYPYRRTVLPSQF